MAKYKHTEVEWNVRRVIADLPEETPALLAGAAGRVGLDEDEDPQPVTLEAMVLLLEQLVALYNESTRALCRKDDELRQLRADLAAVRRVLKLPAEGT